MTSPTRLQHATSREQLASPGSNGRLRKLRSAHQLSSQYANSGPGGPSLISQQRQQQQSHHHHDGHTSNFPPPVPPIPAIHSPQKPARARSNSDAALTVLDRVTSSPRKSLAPRKSNALPKDAKQQVETLVRDGPKDDVSLALQNLRHWILCDGMDADNDGMSHLRIYVWLILLNAAPMSTDEYLDLTRRGPSPAHAKICNDTFRTFKTNPLFKRRVTDNSLIRLLNAAAWKLSDAKQRTASVAQGNSMHALHASTDDGSPELRLADLAGSEVSAGGGISAPASGGIYVQGMNVLCAPFLYVARSEPEAFAAFYRFITRECPGYVRGAMDGVHRGSALVDRCLVVVDPRLAAYLVSKGARAEIYAFASILTMCASTPPLPEVLHLWDFLFAYGAHLNILCICAQLMIMREELLASPSPGKLLRAFPALDAKKVIMLTVSMAPKIPDDLYDELVHHAE